MSTVTAEDHDHELQQALPGVLRADHGDDHPDQRADEQPPDQDAPDPLEHAEHLRPPFLRLQPASYCFSQTLLNQTWPGKPAPSRSLPVPPGKVAWPMPWTLALAGMPQIV